MNSPHGMAMTAAFVLPEAPDIRLLFMAGLVFLAAVAGTGSILLLLLFAPIISLALLGRGAKRNIAATTPRAYRQLKKPEKSDGGATRPPPRIRGDEAA